MSAASSRSASRSGTPLGTRPHPSNTSQTTQRTSSSSSSSSFTNVKSTSTYNPNIHNNNNNSNNNNINSNYFSYPVSRVMSGLYRRLADPPQKNGNNMITSNSSSTSLFKSNGNTSPFQPPPLTPLTLKASNTTSRHILSRALAEEIRLLVPPRLQLVDTWQLAYSLERDGSSLATVYDTCRQVAERNPRAGYVLVIRDTSGGAIFGAYLTDPPHPNSHFYGTGECFLWRASVLPSTPVIWQSHNHNSHSNHHEHENGEQNQEQQDNNHHHDDDHEFHTMTDEELRKAGFPPPPSADTTYAVRSTTLRASTPTRPNQSSYNNNALESTPLSLRGSGDYTTRSNRIQNNNTNNNSGTTTPERIRFKAFPYSGINDYMIFCETGFLSVGGGDGHYGLWIDDSVEKGISDSCPTFGNEPLSDEGKKFDILDIEIWYIGS